MATDLILKLAADQIWMELDARAASNGPIAKLRQLVGARNRSNSPPPSAATHVIREPDIKSLPADLEHAWSDIKDLQATQWRQPTDLHVELGSAYARLGVVRLASATGRVDAVTTQNMVEAWVSHSWNLAPTTQVLRWRALRHDKSRLLVSAVDSQVLAGLQTFANRHRLRFVTCKPAMVADMERLRKQATHQNCTLVWLEATTTGERKPVVQLARLRGGEPESIWRGWVTAPASDDLADDGLRGAIARFHAACGLAEMEPAAQSCWPATSIGVQGR